jgi:hypothetical protein
VCAAASTAAAADGVLVVETSTVNGNPRTTQVQIERSRMRTEIAGQNGTSQVVIFDGTKQVLYMIDPAAKTYSEMTKADVDAAGAQMGDAMAQMQKALEGMPPAQRAQMEAMMKGRLGGLPGAGGAALKTEYRRGGTSKGIEVDLRRLRGLPEQREDRRGLHRERERARLYRDRLRSVAAARPRSCAG